MRRLTVILLLSTLGQAQDWVWRGTAPLSEARSGACIQRLPDGRVLVSGGQGQTPLATVEIFQSKPEEVFTSVSPMQSARVGHGCTLLEDGRVLVAGGGSSSVEIYEPSLDTWTTVESTVTRGAGTFALRLLDGRILIAGGRSAILEAFDTGSGELSVLPGNLLSLREKQTMTLLNDGRILIAGGAGEQGGLNTAEIFDPETGEVKSVPAMSGPRAGHTATLLFDGRVLLAGGTNGEVELNTLEVYLPESNRFEALSATLKDARQNHTGLLVETNGTVLLAGGSAAGKALATTELFDPSENQVLEAGSLTAARSGIAGVMLEDGSVLATGGRNEEGPSRACGVIASSTLRFTQGVYRPLERATISGSLGVTSINSRVTFELSRIDVSSGQQTIINNRLLVTSAAVSNGILPLTGIMNVFRDDIGSDFLLTVKATPDRGGKISLQARFSVKLRTAIQVTALGGISVADQPVIARVQLTADGNPVTFSGSIAVRAGGITKTQIFSPGLNSSLTINVSICCDRTDGIIQMSGSYPGNRFLESSTSANTSHIVVSRSPAVSLVLPTLTLGAPATLTAFVSIQAPNAVPSQAVDPALRPSGSVTFRKGTGESLGSAALQPFSGLTLSPLPSSQAQVTYTPGIADRRARTVCFDAAYSGDSRYLAVDKPVSSGGSVITVSGPCTVVAAAVPRLQVLSSPATYALGTPARFSVRLTWPDSVGIISRTVNVLADGSARGQITLVPNPNGLGIADGSADVILPFNTKTLTFVYDPSGDLQGAQASSAIAMGRVSTTVSTTLRDPIANPFTIPYALRLNTGGVPLPPGISLGGNIEFRDGNTLLGTLPAPILQAGPGITDGTSNTIFLSEIRTSGSLTNVIRPTGLRTITIRYTGSPQFLDSQAQATVTVP